MEQRYPKAKGEAIDTSAVNIVTHVRQLHANFDQNPESKVGYIYQRNNNSSNINCNNNNINNNNESSTTAFARKTGLQTHVEVTLVQM